jgi:hypothetical protein
MPFSTRSRPCMSPCPQRLATSLENTLTPETVMPQPVGEPCRPRGTIFALLGVGALARPSPFRWSRGAVSHSLCGASCQGRAETVHHLSC